MFVTAGKDMKRMKYQTMIKQELTTSIFLIYIIFTFGMIISTSANIIIRFFEIM